MVSATSLSHLGLLVDAQVVGSPVVLAVRYVIATLDTARVWRAAPNERLGFLMSENYWTEETVLLFMLLLPRLPSRPLPLKRGC
jgi:hypothetical protein